MGAAHKKEKSLLIYSDNRKYNVYKAPKSENHCDFCCFKLKGGACGYSQIKSIPQHVGCGYRYSTFNYYFRPYIAETLEQL